MSKLNLHESHLVRQLFVAAGLISLLLGVVGVFLPVLPTTPFILLAAALFARGSETFHRWLMEHHLTGPVIREWYEHRKIPSKVKPWALLFTAISFGSSIIVVSTLWLRILLAILGVVLVTILWRIPVRKN